MHPAVPRHRALLDLACDRSRPLALREQALWVAGHGREADIGAALFRIANDPDEPAFLRRIAATRWFALDPAGAVGAAAHIRLPWPRPVWEATLTVMIDAAHADAWRAWCEVARRAAPELGPLVSLLLGDTPAAEAPWVLMADGELKALELPGAREMDWAAALAAGRAWEAARGDPDPFHQFAVRDALLWSRRVLAFRVATARYHPLREWERWLAAALGSEVDPVPAPPEYCEVALGEALPSDGATAHAVLGALLTHLPDTTTRARTASNRLRSQAAVLHLATADAYQNARITGWHVGGYTGRLYDVVSKVLDGERGPARP